MAHVYDFSSDKIDIFELLIDSSGSMEDEEMNVKKGLNAYRKSFENFPEANSIAVSVSRFNGELHLGEFRRIREINTSYSAHGSTALYYSIYEAAKRLKNYIAEVTKRTGCIPKATFILFSDGVPYDDRMRFEDAKNVIEMLNYAGITTVFVAFGNAITSEFGKKLGFMSTIDATKGETLVNFLGVELSKSCKEQSKSLKGLGANFFSKAANDKNSEGYSHTTAQALEDDSWINDI